MKEILVSKVFSTSKDLCEWVNINPQIKVVSICPLTLGGIPLHPVSGHFTLFFLAEQEAVLKDVN